MNELLPEIIVTNYQLVNGMFSEADRLVKEKTNLTLTQMLILQSTQAGDCSSQEEISDVLGISQPAISKQISQLLDNGIVKEKKRDKRSFQIIMTKKGEAEFEKAMDIYHSYNLDIFSTLTREEIISFVSTLQKLIQQYNKKLD